MLGQQLVCFIKVPQRYLRKMLEPQKIAQLYATTRHVVSCAWCKCVPIWPTDTPSPITTRHVASYDTKLCNIWWS